MKKHYNDRGLEAEAERARASAAELFEREM